MLEGEDGCDGGPRQVLAAAHARNCSPFYSAPPQHFLCADSINSFTRQNGNEPPPFILGRIVLLERKLDVRREVGASYSLPLPPPPPQQQQQQQHLAPTTVLRLLTPPRPYPAFQLYGRSNHLQAGSQVYFEVTCSALSTATATDMGPEV